ncbi:hypothetical protein [Sphingopyxis sp. 22461]|uniref:hypothetical protein n=1 Tax=Sphingopyxis sp. 22461 TaxID=3453923 RepID=UPI003F879FC4
MSSDNSANFQPLVSRERIGNAQGAALRLFVGRGRRYSVKQLANGSGIKDRVIESAMCAVESPDYRPLSQEALASIGLFLGATFTNEWIGLMGQGAFDLPDEEPDPGALAADNSDDNATVTRAAIDGKFDDYERPGLTVVGSRMVTRGSQLVALGKRRAA